MSGAASKGIVKAGVVVAEELDATATVIAIVGNATTVADGSYSLTLNSSYTGGPIQITISADTDTQMKCDVPGDCGTRTDGLPDTNDNTTINFGEWYKPASLTMTALVPGAVANAEIGVSVTPFTHMAAELAKSAASFNSAAVASANSEVSNLLGGIDILNTAPVDITDVSAINDDATSRTQVTYAALTSAIANQGLTDPISGQPDLDAAIALLAASFAGGVIQADDPAQISLQEIVDAANATFDAMGIGDVTGVLAGLQSDIDGAGGGIIDPEPSSTVSDSNLDKVKAMVRDVRTWGNVIRAETEAEANAFETQITLASNAGSVLLDDARANALDAAIRAATRYTDGENDLSTDYYDLGLADQFSSGAITSATPGEITITDGEIYDHTVNMTVKLPDDGTTASTFELGIVSATVNHANADLIVNSGMVNVTLVSNYTIDYAAIEGGTAPPVPDVTDATFDLDVQFTRKADDQTGVALVSPVTFAGSLLFDIRAIPVTGSSPTVYRYLPTTFSLTGSVNNTIGDSVNISLVGNVTNTDSFEFIDPVLIIESASNWIDADIGLTFTVQLSGLPEARVNITGDRTGFEAGDVTTTISYGTRQIAIVTSLDSAVTPATGTVTITNQDGIVMTMAVTKETGSPATGTVSYNATNYADVAVIGSGYVKVSYIDGTFEIF